jgi:hypothetical protein
MHCALGEQLAQGSLLLRCHVSNGFSPSIAVQPALSRSCQVGIGKGEYSAFGGRL